MIWQVIKFLDLEEREKFKKNVDNFLVDLQIEREIHEFTEKSIYDNAQTKEERQKYLDKFFRVICLQVYEINVKFYFSFCLFLYPPPVPKEKGVDCFILLCLSIHPSVCLSVTKNSVAFF